VAIEAVADALLSMEQKELTMTENTTI
jgi:hypothetical protein